MNLDPTVGHEQAGDRVCLVISDERYMTARWGMVVVVPITTHPPRNRHAHVAIDPERDNVAPGAFLCDQVRAVSVDRLRRFVGAISEASLQEVERALRDVLGL
ncbi:MAG: type II toxin-antitoxin system PemK/MazF family toxin [Planctomycetes bacterium]|nr:type II toxin-antitoxin system PemK/MazF family toxin [Planctomycetota bacterium]